MFTEYSYRYDLRMKPKMIEINDLKNHTLKYIHEVQLSQKPIVIKERGNPIAELIPIQKDNLVVVEGEEILGQKPNLSWKELESLENWIQNEVAHLNK